MRLTITVLAMLALVGSAMAWDETGVLTYSFKKTASEQDGFEDLSGTKSYAGFEEPDNGETLGTSDKGDMKGAIYQQLYSVTADPLASTWGDTHQMLVQEGTIKVEKAALSSEDKVPELSVQITKSQDYVFSGQFSEVSASFIDSAQAGTNCDPAIDDMITSCGNLHAEQSTVSNDKPTGTVTATGGARLSEGAIGTDSWTSLKADAWKNQVTMDGGLSVYSQFFGDSIVPSDGAVTTSVSGSSTHNWNADNGYGDAWNE